MANKRPVNSPVNARMGLIKRQQRIASLLNSWLAVVFVNSNLRARWTVRMQRRSHLTSVEGSKPWHKQKLRSKNENAAPTFVTLTFTGLFCCGGQNGRAKLLRQAWSLLQAPEKSQLTLNHLIAGGGYSGSFS